MRDDDMKMVMDRAAGPGDLPAGLVDRVIAGARARRRRKLGVAAGALAVLATAGIVWAPLRAREEPAPPAPPTLAQELGRLGEAVGAPVPPERVLAAAATGAESVLVLSRASNQPGEKAAEVWIARDGEAYRMVSDYLSYDFGCLADDQVCEEVRPTGLGLYLVRQDGDGRTFVLATAPDGRRVEVVTADGTATPVPAQRGVLIQVRAADANKAQVRAYLPDGRHYVLPPAPGAVLTS